MFIKNQIKLFAIRFCFCFEQRFQRFLSTDCSGVVQHWYWIQSFVFLLQHKNRMERRREKKKENINSGSLSWSRKDRQRLFGLKGWKFFESWRELEKVQIRMFISNFKQTRKFDKFALKFQGGSFLIANAKDLLRRFWYFAVEISRDLDFLKIHGKQHFRCDVKLINFK